MRAQQLPSDIVPSPKAPHPAQPGSTVVKPAAGASPRRFVFAFLATALIGCLILGLFNFIVNPLNYYPPRLVQPLSYGDQLTKIDLMKQQSQKPEALILGSSRTMKLAPADVKALSGLIAFNGGVSSSRPEEWYSMLRYALDDLHWPLKELIMGVDLETLYYRGEPNEDLLSSPELRRHLPSQMWLSSLEERGKLLISWDMTMLSKKALTLALGPQPPKDITFDPDGLLHYGAWEKAVADGTFKLVTIYNVTNYKQRYDLTPTLDPQRQALFEQLLALAAQHHIRVRMFATTFQPQVLAEMQKLDSFNQIHAAALSYLSGQAARYPDVSFVDFTEVASFGGDPNNFFDGVHIRPENAHALLQRLYGR